MDYLTYRWTTHGITIYTTYISEDLAQHVIFRAKVGKVSINFDPKLTCIISIYKDISDMPLAQFL